MEATTSDWILVRCECRLGEPAIIIAACSTRAHRGLCATGRTYGTHAPRSVRHKYGEPAAFAGQDSADYRINAGRVREVLTERRHFGSKQIAKARS